ncbi:hypothetical protein P872_19200 [Rhodonellum psychrophilum GCM71 = DSM 17998]|uniref:SusD/RagB family nutrient-binding outer membrane lipoprotein n=2 Tax=Rhodonellum TaxID=336827 RepID=U5BV82_9BACT|nr:MULTISPECIES: SusD/RagB family nutrient-binding outer membrane lipoprotein [Rhodonellum]ERM81783.1 hypothetical protein P872_19200 [Rhodonellum psychrophilum GCM71 = DSM 17998]SDZ47827.1 Starch-binding associating with outer membrane [Rhodonellum ikkaensis]
MKLNNIIPILLTGFFLVSCQSFEDLQLDPNRPVQAEPSLILTAVEANAFSTVNAGAALASRQLIYTNSATDNQYYGWQRSGFGDYDQLRQILKLKDEADRTENNSYRALALFFQSYYIIKLTNTFGDIPFSTAVKGIEGDFSPIYDTQESIFVRVLQDLREANTLIGPDSGEILGDIIFNGDQDKWKRLINSFTLRVLMSLSIKENDTNLNIKSKFGEILNNPSIYPIMRNNADNGALRFLDLEGNRYPFFNSNELRTAYYMEMSFVDRLKQNRDPRLFIYADKTSNGRALADNNFDAYLGLGGAEPLADNTNQILLGNGSPIDSRYHSDPENQPSLLMGYSELAFTIAEAAARGWVNVDPEVYYKEGIRASMLFNELTDSDVDNYLNRESVQLQAGNAMRQILEEKHTSFFMNTGWEAFYNQRRTGIPAFSLSNQIINPEGIPKRWMYPQNEIQLNLKNMNEALQRQFGGEDDVNAVMWLLKP